MREGQMPSTEKLWEDYSTKGEGGRKKKKGIDNLGPIESDGRTSVSSGGRSLWLWRKIKGEEERHLLLIRPAGKEKKEGTVNRDRL